MSETNNRNQSQNRSQSKVNNLVHGDNKFADTLAQIESKTGIKREHILCAILAIPVFSIALLLGGDLIIVILALVYPGVKTAEAVESKESNDKSRWLAYWVVICVSFCIGWIVDAFLFWLPGLFWMKACYIVWLHAPPPYSGTVMIYQGFISPKLKQILPQIRQQVDNIVNTGRSMTSGGTPRGSGAGEQAQRQSGQRPPGQQGSGAGPSQPGGGSKQQGASLSASQQQQQQQGGGGSQAGSRSMGGGSQADGRSGGGSQMESRSGAGSQMEGGSAAKGSAAGSQGGSQMEDRSKGGSQGGSKAKESRDSALSGEGMGGEGEGEGEEDSEQETEK